MKRSCHLYKTCLKANHIFFFRMWIFIRFLMINISNCFIYNSCKLMIISIFIFFFISLIITSSINFKLNIWQQILLFNLFPSISEFLNTSKSKQSFIFSKLPILTHCIQAYNILHFLCFIRLTIDFRPFFIIWFKLFSQFFWFLLFLILCIFKFLLFFRLFSFFQLNFNVIWQGCIKCFLW
jgi:hypothetical protein